MHLIFLSPHLDDVVLSCGGFIWELVQRGMIAEIWTIFAGDTRLPLSDYAQSLHRRWSIDEDGIQLRRAEDLAASRRLGTRTRHFSLPDVIYRHLNDGQAIIHGDEDLFQAPHPQEVALVDEIRDHLLEHLPKGASLIAPLGLGGHVDHRLVRSAAEKLPLERWYYADFPYIAIHRLTDDRFTQADWKTWDVDVTESGLNAWQEAVACYRSQISTFWENADSMADQLREYWSQGGGQRLWQPHFSS